MPAVTQGTGNSVVDAIFSVATDNRVRMAMLMGAWLESGWNPAAVGDHGNSHGIFQINLPFHPSMNAAKAHDPVQAATYMLKSYQAGVSRVTPALWNTDPALASATAAFYAERPAVMYPSSRIQSGWPKVSSAMQGKPIDGNYGEGNALDDANSGGILDLSGGTGQSLSERIFWPIGNFLNWIYIGSIIAGGTLIMAVGFYLLFKNASSVGSVAANTRKAFVTVASLGRK